jgi:hypothetical protein
MAARALAAAANPRSRGSEAPRGAHWSSITLARRDSRVCETRRIPLRPGRRPSALHRGDFRPRDYASSPAGATAGSASRRARGRTVRPGRVPRLPRRGSRRSHGTPLPAPPSGSSPETPLDERGCESSTIDTLRSQAQNVVVTGYATPPTSLLAVRSRRPQAAILVRARPQPERLGAIEDRRCVRCAS